MVRLAPLEKKTGCRLFGQKSNPARNPLVPVQLLKHFDIPAVCTAPSGLPESNFLRCFVQTLERKRRDVSFSGRSQVLRENPLVPILVQPKSGGVYCPIRLTRIKLSAFPRPAPPEKKMEYKFFGQRSNPARSPLIPIPVQPKTL